MGNVGAGRPGELSQVPLISDLARWSARLLSVGAALFVLAFAMGEEARQGSFNARSGFLMLCLLAGLGANLLAWRWETAGAASAFIALACLITVEQVANGRLPGIWFFIIIGAPAVLHVASALLRARPGP